MNQRQEIEQAIKKFRKEVDKIRTSDNPYYHDAKVQEYEIKALRAELDAFVAEKNSEFNAIMTQEIEKAEAEANKSRFIPNETQKKEADYALDSFVADITLARDDVAKYAAYNRLDERMDDMEAEALSHIRLQLPSVLSRVNGDEIATKKLKNLNETLSGLKTAQQERLDELKAEKRIGADGAFRRLRVTHPAFSDYRDNINR